MVDLVAQCRAYCGKNEVNCLSGDTCGPMMHEEPCYGALADEIEKLRAALIECGRASGAFLTDEVSTEFLLHVPDEVKARLAGKPAPARAVPFHQSDDPADFDEFGRLILSENCDMETDDG